MNTPGSSLEKVFTLPSDQHMHCGRSVPRDLCLPQHASEQGASCDPGVAAWQCHADVSTRCAASYPAARPCECRAGFREHLATALAAHKRARCQMRGPSTRNPRTAQQRANAFFPR